MDKEKQITYMPPEAVNYLGRIAACMERMFPNPKDKPKIKTRKIENHNLFKVVTECIGDGYTFDPSSWVSVEEVVSKMQLMGHIVSSKDTGAMLINVFGESSRHRKMIDGKKKVGYKIKFLY